MEIPGWLRPWVGWVVGSDWPQADERALFRMADALVRAARRIVATADGSGQWLTGGVRGEWDGGALKAFVKRVGEVVGGRQADLVEQLVTMAIGLNDLGVQVQYTKRMIKLTVLLFVVQMLWLTWALLHPAGRLTVRGLFKARAQVARWTVRQFGQRLAVNVACFGLLMGTMDLYVQGTQSRRDAIDWKQVGTSAGMGALNGGLLTGLAWALPTRSLWMLMGHTGVASAGATVAGALLSGQPVSLKVVAEAFTSGVVSVADGHLASWSPHGPRADGGGAARPDAERPARIGDDDPRPQEPAPAPEGPGPHVARGADAPHTDLAQVREGTDGRRIDQLINRGGDAHVLRASQETARPHPEAAHAPGSRPVADALVHHFGRNGGEPNGQNHVGRDTEVAGTVYRRVDFPVRDMRPGAEFTLPDTVLNTRSYTADHLAPTEIVTYSRTGRDLGDGQVAQAPGTRMRVLGAHEGAYIAPDGQAGTRLYLVEVGNEPLPVHPAPHLEPRHAEMISRFREEVAAGVWYRDRGSMSMPTADPRLLRPTSGIIDVGVAADGTHFLIGEHRLTAGDLGTMLVHDPRLIAAPDAALRVLGCETAANHGLLQELANTTGREVIAGDRYVYIGADRQAHTANIQGYTADGRPMLPHRGDGAWHIAVPEARVERPAVAAEVKPPRAGVPAAPESLRAAIDAEEATHVPIRGGSDGKVDIITLDDVPQAIRKEMHGRVERPARIEVVVSQVGQAIGANVARVMLDPYAKGAVLADFIDASGAHEVAHVLSGFKGRRDAILIGLLDVLTANSDRAARNLMLTDDGRFFAIDHARSFDGDRITMHRDQPFASNFIRRRPDGLFGWVDNPLTRQDVDLITERLQALRPEFERHGLHAEYEVMMDRLYQVADHATGRTPLIAVDAGPGVRLEHHFGWDFDAFQRAYDEAVHRLEQGEDPGMIVPYMTADAIGVPRAFGVELEFALPGRPPETWRAVVDEIARELHEKGLADDSTVYGHHGSDKGYDQGWRVELEFSDHLVAGEVISPILRDSPETWANLATVVDVIRSHGGEITTSTGGHIHVGVDFRTSVVSHVRLLKLYHAFEDVLYRLAQDPRNPDGLHRAYDECLPNADVDLSRADLEEVRLLNHRAAAVNFGYVRGGRSDHVEFRLWDGHLDPSIIQARIKLSVALAEAATRDPGGAPPMERLGHHWDQGERTPEQDSASFRDLVETLFPREVDRQQLAALFAITRWQPSDDVMRAMAGQLTP
ncbi:amidoligase family protein [Nonomuraea sp. NPDC049028]|uniref:WXG100-like domain-containing protein n=1 Tax=Nonomuraea sp. NPDC049028 TaxID=3364348 RepID=UPI0037239CF7